jgi:hypothetical protein
MQAIREEKYQAIYDKNAAIVTLQGAFLLNGAPAYEPILQILQTAADEQVTRTLTLDITNLSFLNSSGINMMTRFIMYVIEIKKLNLTIVLRGQKQIAWQARLAINLQRLMPELQADLC